MRKFLPAVIAAAFAVAGSAWAGTPSIAECGEAAEFIVDAAKARDNGMPRDVFLDDMDGDFLAVTSFPPALRWFVHDAEDETFLRDATRAVFDQPLAPEAHRTPFLLACLARTGGDPRVRDGA